MPLAYPASNFHSENAAVFAQCVELGTQGEISITTHPGGSLYGGGDIKRAVQRGQVFIGERLLSAHQNEETVFGVDSIPFLATSYDASVALWNAVRPTLEERLDDQGLVLLYSVPWPPQGLYFNKPVEMLDDVTGLKFRAYNTSTARLAELAEMVPVQIEAAELSQALATGVAEAVITSAATGADSRLWEHLSHFYQVEAWLPRNHIIMNQDSWENLDDTQRGVLRGCAAAAEIEGLQRSKDYNEATVQALQDNGMTVAAPSDALRDELKAIGDQMTQEWLEAAGDEGKAIIDAYRASMEDSQ